MESLIRNAQEREDRDNKSKQLGSGVITVKEIRDSRPNFLRAKQEGFYEIDDDFAGANIEDYGKVISEEEKEKEEE